MAWSIEVPLGPAAGELLGPAAGVPSPAKVPLCPATALLAGARTAQENEKRPSGSVMKQMDVPTLPPSHEPGSSFGRGSLRRTCALGQRPHVSRACPQHRPPRPEAVRHHPFQSMHVFAACGQACMDCRQSACSPRAHGWSARAPLQAPLFRTLSAGAASRPENSSVCNLYSRVSTRQHATEWVKAANAFHAPNRQMS